MVKSTGAAGLERIELKQLAERVGKLYSVLREAAEAELTPLAAFKPPTDVCETTDAILIRVYGEKRKRNPRQKILSHLCSERNYGPFSRVVPLRWTIKIKESKAELRNGVLLIHLPKTLDRRGSEYKVPLTEID